MTLFNGFYITEFCHIKIIQNIRSSGSEYPVFRFYLECSELSFRRKGSSEPRTKVRKRSKISVEANTGVVKSETVTGV